MSTPGHVSTPGLHGGRAPAQPEGSGPASSALLCASSCRRGPPDAPNIAPVCAPYLCASPPVCAPHQTQRACLCVSSSARGVGPSKRRPFVRLIVSVDPTRSPTAKRPPDKATGASPDWLITQCGAFPSAPPSWPVTRGGASHGGPTKPRALGRRAPARNQAPRGRSPGLTRTRNHGLTRSLTL